MAGYQRESNRLLFINKGKLLYYEQDPKNPEEKLAKTYDAYSGIINDITFQQIVPKNDNKPYEAINIHMQDGDEKVVVTCKFNSGYGRAFAKAIGNADINKKLALIPIYKEEDDKKISSLLIEQHGSVMKWVFSNDNPGNMPPADKLEVNGNDVWSFTNQMQFLKNYILNNVLGKRMHELLNQSTDIEKMAKATSRMFQPPKEADDPDGVDAGDLPF